MARPRLPIHGVLPLIKPAGVISKDVSRLLLKHMRGLKLGHVGTLDPAAEGVLVLLVGAATRLADPLLALPKTYEFSMCLGEETDTLDRQGRVVFRSVWEDASRSNLEQAIRHLPGVCEQVPPPFSAVKVRGRPLYDYARNGNLGEVDFAALVRKVQIFEAALIRWEPPTVDVRVRCGKGTYVRALAKELARAAGTCATVERLERTEAAGFKSEQCYPMATVLEALAGGASLESFLVPIADLQRRLDEADRYVAKALLAT